MNCQNCYAYSLSLSLNRSFIGFFHHQQGGGENIQSGKVGIEKLESKSETVQGESILSGGGSGFSMEDLW
jgi:hypothetical protein